MERYKPYTCYVVTKKAKTKDLITYSGSPWAIADRSLSKFTIVWNRFREKKVKPPIDFVDFLVIVLLHMVPQIRNQGRR